MSRPLIVVGILALLALDWWQASAEELRLFALSEADGRVRWSAALPALDVRTGAPLWRVVPDRAVLPRNDLGPFLAADESTIFLAVRRGVLALDATSGAPRFQIDEPPGQFGGQVWLDGPTLYRRSGLTTIVAHDAATGAPRWSYRQSFPDPGTALRSFRTAGESLYAFCACEVENHGDRGWLLAVDTRDGRERWRALLDAYIELYQDKLAIGSQTVILGSEREDVVARSAADGNERWRFRRTIGRSVAAADGLVFATDRAPRWRHWLAGINPDWH